MKTRTFLLAALALALLPVSARQSLPASPSPAWIQEFNNLPETTRKSYIAQFRKAEQLFAQKKSWNVFFPSWSWKNFMPEIRAYTTSAAHATLKSAISKRPWKILKSPETGSLQPHHPVQPGGSALRQSRLFQGSESFHGTPSPLQGQSRHDAPAAIQALYLRPQTG